jgi:intracellular septation protein
MQVLIDFIPLLAFAVTYWLTDFRTAVIAIIIAILLQVAVTWLRTGTVSRVLLFSAILAVVFGGVGLVLQNDTVFKWKPTVFSWVIATALLASHYLGSKPLVQHLLDATARGELQLEARDWRILNLMWAGFFLFTGAANVFVAYSFSESFWVNFKVFGLTGLTIAFSLLQGLWIFRRDPARATQDR